MAIKRVFQKEPVLSLSLIHISSILWKDASRSGEACTMMKLTAQDLYTDGIVEEIIAEPLGRCV